MRSGLQIVNAQQPSDRSRWWWRSRLAVILVGVFLGPSALPAEPDPSARFLVIVFDAVPFQAAIDLTSNGDTPLLEEFAGPVPLVSTFPSNTSVALSAILERFGPEPPPGYEVKFFDHEANKIRGGGLIAYRNIRFDWHHFFDWQLHGFFRKSMAYARPKRYSVKEVHKAIEAFAATDRPAFFVYVNSTDAIGHIDGPEGLRRAFENLDAELQTLRDSSPVPIYTVVLSDHGLGGGVLLRNARQGIFEALAADGWRTAKKIRRNRDVVLTPFGLVSSFEAYTHEGNEGDVAEALIGAPGVDLCAFREDGGWTVLDEHGRAEIRRRQGTSGTEWAYRVETSDALRLSDALDRLRERDPDSEWFSERAWFDQSWDGPYPDPLFRIASGFERVRNPASVLCSISNGFLYGGKGAWIGSKMSVGPVRWTHGALLRNESLGFLMTDYPGWTEPTAVRFDDALNFLADHLLASEPR